MKAEKISIKLLTILFAISFWKYIYLVFFSYKVVPTKQEKQSSSQTDAIA